MIVIQEDWEEGYNCGIGEFRVAMSDGVYSDFEVKDWQIVTESNNNDSQDDNDVARWLVRALLEIRQAEYKDENMHCDWSAEDCISGPYHFECSLERCTRKQKVDMCQHCSVYKKCTVGSGKHQRD